MPDGRRLLGSGNSGAPGRGAAAAGHGLLQGLRRLLLLPDQAAPSPALHLQLGSDRSSADLRQGDEMESQQAAGAPQPSLAAQHGKPTRLLSGNIVAPVAALEAASFLDTGGPTTAIQPAAAPSKGAYAHKPGSLLSPVPHLICLFGVPDL